MKMRSKGHKMSRTEAQRIMTATLMDHIVQEGPLFLGTGDRCVLLQQLIDSARAVNRHDVEGKLLELLYKVRGNRTGDQL